MHEDCDAPFLSHQERLELVNQCDQHNFGVTLAASCLPRSLQNTNIADNRRALPLFADDNNNARSAGSSATSSDKYKPGRKGATSSHQQHSSMSTLQDLSGMLQLGSIQCVSKPPGDMNRYTDNNSLALGQKQDSQRVSGAMKNTSRSWESMSETTTLNTDQKQKSGGGLKIYAQQGNNTESTITKLFDGGLNHQHGETTTKRYTDSSQTPNAKCGDDVDAELRHHGGSTLPARLSTRPKGKTLVTKDGKGAKQQAANAGVREKQRLESLMTCFLFLKRLQLHHFLLRHLVESVSKPVCRNLSTQKY